MTGKQRALAIQTESKRDSEIQRAIQRRIENGKETESNKDSDSY